MACPPERLAHEARPDLTAAPSRPPLVRPPLPWSRLHELLEAQVETSPDETIVRVAGELDIASAPKLAELLVGDCGGTKRVLLDLSGVRFIDAYTIRVLLGARDMLESFGSRLTVLDISGQVRRVLSLCDMLDVLVGTES